MEIQFSKYHGTGNDFILIDARSQGVKLSNEHIAHLCHRRFGIGADGLMLLKKSDKYDFAMQYFNSDGNEGSMCGNGGRCITAFASRLGIIKNHAVFEAVDGLHEASIEENIIISLRMSDTRIPENLGDGWFLNTGSPHFVVFRENVSQIDVESEGRQLRHSQRFAPGGCNVNFVENQPGNIFVRTFERGVEAETLSCGTGAVACALCVAFSGNKTEGDISLNTPGGNLHVSFIRNGDSFTRIILRGAAQHVFDGKILLA